ncbi:tail fiber protein [Flavobacterium bizetiae]|uniref:tail fiber protein n=1 Tax=Flavobacterium bizetiae TaxID=2704140 RepID=UPI0021E93E03|nr:tail fiber protein [Flavobacterium bizetiae]UTN03047.1 tail fiber protein [Flavobacterium bizetiae]
MKKITTILTILFVTTVSFSQQIGDGLAPGIDNFNNPLSSGLYSGLNPIGRIPDTSHIWSHLFVIRHGNLNNHFQLQIASSYVENERLFFRKLAGISNPAWVELATRGANSFTGNQIIDGDVVIGTNNNVAKLTIQASPDGFPTPLKAISIKGPNSPENANSARDISWDFAAAGSASIRSYRGNNYDTYLQFLTNPNSASGNVPQTRLHINDDGNIGIGTTNPQNKLDVKGTIHSQEVKVDMEGWSDFVFKKEYNLPTLEDVEKHINEKGHLENIPNEEEVLKNGINLGEINAKLLQKIEEMTLYMIDMKKENIEMKTKQIQLENTVKEFINKLK